MFSFKLKFIFAFFLLIFLFSFVSSALIDNCRDINSDIFGVTNTLTRDINGWVGTCFPLTEAADGNSFTLDCDRYSIDANSDSNILFDTLLSNIDIITFKNCDMNLFGSNVYGFRVDSDVNFIVVSDSNLDTNSGSIVYSINFADDTIDLNFFGSTVNVSGLGQMLWIDGATVYNTVNVRDLNLVNSGPNPFYLLGDADTINILDSVIVSSLGQDFDIEIPSSTLNLNFSGTDYSFSDTAFYFTTTNLSSVTINNLNARSTGGELIWITDADLNNVTILDSNLDLDATATFFQFNSGTNDFISFDLNNTDVNYVRVNEDTPLDLTAFTSNDSFIQVNAGSDVNLIEIRTTDSSQTAGNYIEFNGVTDSEVTLDFGDSDFNFSNTRLLYLLSSDINSVTVTDVNTVSRGTSQFLHINTADINFIDISSSTVDFNDNYVISLNSMSDSSLELTLTGNVWNVTDDAGFMYVTGDLGILSINDLDINFFENNYNTFTLVTADLNQFNLFNSSIIGSTDVFGGSSFITFNSVTDSSLDLNFSGSDINLPNNLYFFGIAGSNLSEITITDLNIVNFDSANSFIFTNATSDLNSLILLNSSLVLNNQVFFDDTITSQDDFLSVDFNNTDANYLYFTDLNLNLTSFSDENYFLQLSDGSDLNYVVFSASSKVDMNNGTFLNVLNITDSDISLDFSGFDLNITGIGYGINFSNANYTTTDMLNFDVYFDSTDRFVGLLSPSDLNTINLLDSNIVVNKGDFFQFYSADNSVDLNLQDSNITFSGISFGFNSVANSLGTLTISNASTFDFGSSNSLFLRSVSGDWNLISFLDSSLNMQSNIFYDGLSGSDSYLAFDFNNTDVNYLLFNDLNLNLIAIDDDDILFNFTDGSDLNYLEFSGSSTIDSNSFYLFATQNNADSEINLDFNTVDMAINGTKYGLVFTDANYTTVNVSNLSIDFNTPFSLFSSAGSSDLNIINLLSSDINMLMGAIYYWVNTEDSVDFNFNGSVFDFSNLTYGFVLFDANIDSLTVYNASSFDFAGDYPLFGGNETYSNDWNSITFVDSSLNLNNSVFFDGDSNQDSYLSIDFNNTDVNYLKFTDLNLNLTQFTTGDFLLRFTNTSDMNFIDFLNTSVTQDSGTSFVQLDNLTDDSIDLNFGDANVDLSMVYLLYTSNANIGTATVRDLNYTGTFSASLFYISETDVNVLNFFDSVVNDNSGILGMFKNNNDSEVDLNFSGTSLNLSSASGAFVEFADTNQGTVNVYNVDLTSSGLIAFYVLDNVGGAGPLPPESVPPTDVNTINIFDSNFVFDGNWFVFSENITDAELDMNFSRSDVNIYTAGAFYFDDSNYTTGFSIYSLTTSQTDANFFTFTNTYIVDLNIADSNFSLDNFADVNADANVQGGTISNNKFWDSNTSNTFIYADTERFNADFNSILEENYSKRILWLSADDTNNVGGNLWVDSTGDNLCGVDIVAPFGICDSAYSILGSDVNYSDALPLRDYDPQDLNVTNIDFNLEPIIYGESVDINATIYNNSTGGSTDTNYFVEYYIGGVLDANYELGDVLASGASIVNTHIWDSNVAGDVNVYVCVNYPIDTNTQNDCNQTTLTVNSVDLNGISLSLASVSVTVSTTVEPTFTFGNIGDANATSDYNLSIYLDGTLECSEQVSADLNIDDTNTYDCNFTAPATAGTYTVEGVISYSGYDNNADNNSASTTLTVTAVSNPPGGGPLKCSVSPTLTVTGGISDTEKASVLVKLNKSGGKDLDDGNMVLYLTTDSGEEEVWGKDVDEEDLDGGKYTETLQYGIAELEEIDSDIFSLVDASGNANFKLTVSGCGGEESEKTNYAKVEYLKSEIKELYFLDGSKKIPVELNGTVNLDVDKTYTLYLVLNTKTINKAKNIDLEMYNETEDSKTVAYWSDNLGGSEVIKESDTEYSDKINVLNLMPHSKAKNFIFDILDLNKQDSEDKKKVDEIVEKLSDEFQSSETDAMGEYFLDLDYISFSSATEYILLKYFEGDIVKDTFSFAIEFEHESEKDSKDPNKNNQGNNEGNSGSESSASGKEGKYFVNYKKKLGLGEIQEFTILNSEKSPIINLNMIVYFEDKNWQFKTDAKGKVLFTPEFEGEYSFGVPYPEEKVKGTFEVIEGYVSSDSDFVEESGGFFSGWSDTAKKSFLAIIIVVVAVLVFVLYWLFRPRRKQGLESLAENI